MATNLRVELRHNQEFVALEEEKKELERQLEKRRNALQDESELKKSVAKGGERQRAASHGR